MSNGFRDGATNLNSGIPVGNLNNFSVTLGKKSQTYCTPAVLRNTEVRCVYNLGLEDISAFGQPAFGRHDDTV